MPYGKSGRGRNLNPISHGRGVFALTMLVEQKHSVGVVDLILNFLNHKLG